MATDNTGTWIVGESKFWYTPTSGLDPMWLFGENQFLDEYVAAGGLKIPVAMKYYGQQRRR